MFTSAQQGSRVLKFSSGYCFCQETLSLSFSDKYWREEGEDKKSML